MSFVFELPPSYCPYCEELTTFDGWGYKYPRDGKGGGVVGFYCDKCGKCKETSPTDDYPLVLDEVKEIRQLESEGD